MGVNLGNVVIDEGNLGVGEIVGALGNLKVTGIWRSGNSTATGSKTAVVDTHDGRRLLYTEESTEVWFIDYRFGKLIDGMAQVAIDPIFVQTVNLAEPYHVFVQVYGDADVYVTNRTATGFEVRLRGGDPSAEFSYRVVAKRLGFEGQRLEPAPSVPAVSAPHTAMPRAAAAMPMPIVSSRPIKRRGEEAILSRHRSQGR